MFLHVPPKRVAMNPELFCNRIQTGAPGLYRLNPVPFRMLANLTAIATAAVFRELFRRGVREHRAIRVIRRLLLGRTLHYQISNTRISDFNKALPLKRSTKLQWNAKDISIICRRNRQIFHAINVNLAGLIGGGHENHQLRHFTSTSPAPPIAAWPTPI